MALSKKQALAIVFSCADQYKSNLVNHSLLFICSGVQKSVYSVEVTFDVSNYKHLTGLKSAVSPQHFFQLCIDRRLKESDFSFAEDGTTQWKLEILPQLVKKNLSANMIGEYNQSQPLLFTEKIAGSISACMGFCKSDGSGRYVPNTVLKGDIRSLSRRADRILLTYRKEQADAQYTEIVYAAKKVDWSQITLPAEYLYLPLP